MDNTSPGSFHTAIAVTPHNSTNIKSRWPARALYVGGAGNITAVFAKNKTEEYAVLFTAVPVGTILPINCIRVNATGTSATQIVALF